MTSFLRNTLFASYGLLNFTNNSTIKGLPKLPSESCRGKVFVITGANSGIGKETALQLAKRGGTVHMVCRSEERGRQARDEIEAATQNPNVHLHVVDVGRPKQIRDFVTKFQAVPGSKVDVLINNAGVLLAERKLNEDGVEESFATNILGPYALIRLLQPLLEASKTRVINVSSGGMYTQRLNVKDLQGASVPFDGAAFYGQQKRQMVVMTDQLSKTVPDARFYSCHPGWSDTPGVEKSLPSFHKSMKGKLRTQEQGCDTMLWLSICSDEELEHGNGKFWYDREVVREHLPLAFTENTQDEATAMMQQFQQLMDEILSR